MKEVHKQEMNIYHYDHIDVLRSNLPVWIGLHRDCHVCAWAGKEIYSTYCQNAVILNTNSKNETPLPPIYAFAYLVLHHHMLCFPISPRMYILFVKYVQIFPHFFLRISCHGVFQVIFLFLPSAFSYFIAVIFESIGLQDFSPDVRFN